MKELFQSALAEMVAVKNFLCGTEKEQRMEDKTSENAIDNAKETYRRYLRSYFESGDGINIPEYAKDEYSGNSYSYALHIV